MNVLWATGLLFASTAQPAIDPANLSQITRDLSSERFRGRAPASPGEKPTLDYIIAQFKQAGVEPAGDKGGWTQSVPLVHTRLGDGAMDVAVGGARVPLVQKQQIYVSTVRPVDRIAIAKAPMVFVGYGVTAPERQWDDFKGQDLKGKVAVFLVNDPDFEAKPGEPAAGKFGGKAMTFYGRWVYKYQEAARRGAIAALIVHDTPRAGYGWNTVIAPGGENYDIVRTGSDQPVLLQGWVEGQAARDLFRRAGLDLDTLRVEARSPSFKPVTIKDATFSADLPVTSEQVRSFNVLGQIKGGKRLDETVMYGAHWDALNSRSKAWPNAASLAFACAIRSVSRDTGNP
jgi:aminopeptidase